MASFRGHLLRKRDGLARLGQNVAIASLVAAAPGAVLAVMEIPLHASYPLIEPYVEYGVPSFCGVAGIAFCGRYISRWRLSRAAKHPDIANLDQREAQTSFPHYTNQVRRQFFILGLSIHEFASNVGISRFKARALLHDPATIPRPELMPKIEHALLLPDGFFSRGKAKSGGLYGTTLTKQRLLRHKARWDAAVHFFDAHSLDPDRSDNRKLNKVLALIEKKIEEQNGDAR